MKWARYIAGPLAALAMATGAAWAADTGVAPAKAGETTLTWVGCGISKKAYMNDIAKIYEKKTGVHIIVNGGGATKGIREVASGQADIGGSCRFKLENNPLERDATLVPVAWDALVVITHPDNPAGNITLEQLRDVFLGKITNWKQLGGHDAPIHVLARKGKISGVGRTLRELVFANYDQDFKATEFFPSTGPLEKAVEKDPDAIGVTGISSARKRDVKILNLDGKDPSYENIRNGDYLLYRPLYLAYRRGGPHEQAVKKFIQFVHGAEGQDVLRANGTVPYLEGIALVRKKLEQAEHARARGLTN